MFSRQKLIDTTSSADTAMDKGDLDRAETLYTKAIIIAEKMYGKNCVSVASLLMSLVRLYKKKGDDWQADFLKCKIQEILATPVEISGQFRKLQEQ
ncbi:MAG: tetratricopeptide repeat protein [Cyanobacteria bacterium TGS_CYA1]|nr:tetratricopeptide repeat protein [Cyanobacteria bacterium TGS_CYA1]